MKKPRKTFTLKITNTNPGEPVQTALMTKKEIEYFGESGKGVKRVGGMLIPQHRIEELIKRDKSGNQKS